MYTRTVFSPCLHSHAFIYVFVWLQFKIDCTKTVSPFSRKFNTRSCVQNKYTLSSLFILKDKHFICFQKPPPLYCSVMLDFCLLPRVGDCRLNDNLLCYNTINLLFSNCICIVYSSRYVRPINEKCINKFPKRSAGMPVKFKRIESTVRDINLIGVKHSK